MRAQDDALIPNTSLKKGNPSELQQFIVVLNSDGSLSVQFNKQAFNPRTHAEKEQLLQQCFLVMLGGFYGDNLFSKNSTTLRKGEQHNLDAPTKLATILSENEFDCLAPNIKEQLLATFQVFTTLASRMQLLGTAWEQIKRTLTSQLTSEKLQQLWVRIKCRLYAELFPDHYADFTAVLRASEIALPEESSVSCCCFFIDSDMLKAKEKQWFIKAKSGPVPLDEFRKQQPETMGTLLRFVSKLLKARPEMLNNPRFQALSNIQSLELTTQPAPVAATSSTSRQKLVGVTAYMRNRLAELRTEYYSDCRIFFRNSNRKAQISYLEAVINNTHHSRDQILGALLLVLHDIQDTQWECTAKGSKLRKIIVAKLQMLNFEVVNKANGLHCPADTPARIKETKRLIKSAPRVENNSWAVNAIQAAQSFCDLPNFRAKF